MIINDFFELKTKVFALKDTTLCITKSLSNFINKSLLDKRYNEFVIILKRNKIKLKIITEEGE